MILFSNSGKLTINATEQAIEKTLYRYTKIFIEENEYVVFTIDAHNEEDNLHPKTKLFPPHNIRGNTYIEN